MGGGTLGAELGMGSRGRHREGGAKTRTPSLIPCRQGGGGRDKGGAREAGLGHAQKVHMMHGHVCRVGGRRNKKEKEEKKTES